MFEALNTMRATRSAARETVRKIRMNYKHFLFDPNKLWQKINFGSSTSYFLGVYGLQMIMMLHTTGMTKF